VAARGRIFCRRALLDGIKAGHAFIKTQSPSGPNVLFTAAAGAQSAIIGDNLHTRAGDTVAFTVEVKGGAGTKVEVIRDGKPASLLEQPQVSADKTALKFRVTTDGVRHWYRVNLRAADGKLLVLTNPIYENFAE